MLIDLRPLQRGAVGCDALQASGASGMGLVDPDLPALSADIEAGFDTVFPNAYAAAHARPGAIMRLGVDLDPLFVARLVLDGAISTVESEPVPGDGTARYWRSAGQDRAGASGGLAVLTLDGGTPLCRRLRALGGELFLPTAFPLLSPTYRHVLFVLGNVRGSSALLALLHRYGGDVLLTDGCLLAAYDDAQAGALAAKELGRAVPAFELAQWREGVARPAALLVGEVAAAARRVFVSSAALATSIAAVFGREAVVVPVPSAGPVVVAHAAGLWAEACVWAAEMLVGWGVDLRLELVCPEGEQAALRALAAQLGIGERVGFAPGLATVLVAPLLAATVLVVVGMRGQWAVPQAVLQVGVPMVVSRSVMEAVAVAAAAVLPDQASPPLLAEALFGLLPVGSGAAETARAILAGLAA